MGSKSLKKHREYSPSTRSLKKANERSDARFFWFFTAPMLAGLLIFVVIPIGWGLVLSFFNARGTIDLKEFVGIHNYILLFREPGFVKSIITILVFGVFMVPATVIFALLLAVMIHNTVKLKGFFRTVFFLPTAFSYVVASMIWRMSIFSGMRFGLVNTFLSFFDIAPVLWTSSSPAVWLPITTVRLWLQVGFFMILYIAGIEEIPEELFEAARVDGVDRGWVLLRHITIPMVKNTTIFIVFQSIINLFRSFDEFYNILVDSVSSSNLHLARTPLIYLYQTGFIAQDYGRGSAGAMIVVLLIVLGTQLQKKFFGDGKAVRS